jgi:hypothetical protein
VAAVFAHLDCRVRACCDVFGRRIEDVFELVEEG